MGTPFAKYCRNCMSAQNNMKKAKFSPSDPRAAVPQIIVSAGRCVEGRYLTFFLSLSNKNTAYAYKKAVLHFLNWCAENGITFRQINVETLESYASNTFLPVPTLRRNLAAVRTFLSWLSERRHECVAV